ncbi:MAG: hypothetical protein HY904_13960 [Deltaproteobacteria bacterium]|nr:hypothetical protein [Deltaproteobacteria bacterium]
MKKEPTLVLQEALHAIRETGGRGPEMISAFGKEVKKRHGVEPSPHALGRLLDLLTEAGHLRHKLDGRTHVWRQAEAKAPHSQVTPEAPGPAQPDPKAFARKVADTPEIVHGAALRALDASNGRMPGLLQAFGKEVRNEHRVALADGVLHGFLRRLADKGLLVVTRDGTRRIWKDNTRRPRPESAMDTPPPAAPRPVRAQGTVALPPELAAMHTIYATLQPLTEAERERALVWAAAHFYTRRPPAPIPASLTQQPLSSSAGEEGAAAAPSGPAGLGKLRSFMSAHAPADDVRRLLCLGVFSTDEMGVSPFQISGLAELARRAGVGKPLKPPRLYRLSDAARDAGWLVRKGTAGWVVTAKGRAVVHKMSRTAGKAAGSETGPRRGKLRFL